MASTPQNLSNHTRFDPLFHFFLLPVFLISFVASLVMLAKERNLHALWFSICVLAWSSPSSRSGSMRSKCRTA